MPGLIPELFRRGELDKTQTRYAPEGKFRYKNPYSVGRAGDRRECMRLFHLVHFGKAGKSVVAAFPGEGLKVVGGAFQSSGEFQLVAHGQHASCRVPVVLFKGRRVERDGAVLLFFSRSSGKKLPPRCNTEAFVRVQAWKSHFFFEQTQKSRRADDVHSGRSAGLRCAGRSAAVR